MVSTKRSSDGDEGRTSKSRKIGASDDVPKTKLNNDPYRKGYTAGRICTEAEVIKFLGIGVWVALQNAKRVKR